MTAPTLAGTGLTERGALGATQLGRIVARGKGLDSDVVEAVTRATLELGTAAVTQLELRLLDPDRRILTSGLLDRGAPLDYGPLRLTVANVGIAPKGTGLELTARARSLGVRRLKDAKGALVRSNLSPSQFVELEARAAGLTVVAEPSPTQPTVSRTADTGNGAAESSWDTIGRLARELGYLTFESAGVLYFGRPSWLIRTLPAVRVDASSAGSLGEDVLAHPACTQTDDDAATVATVDLRVTPGLAERLLPGMALDLAGVPTFDGRYLVTSTSLDLGGGQPARVTATTPVDPTPQPPQAADTTTSGTSSAGGPTDDDLRRLRECESSGNYQANTGNGYYGAYQFDVKTWQGLGYPGRPDQASPATQDAAVRKLYAQRGWQPWPACSRKLNLPDRTATTASTSSGATGSGTAAAFVDLCLKQAGDRYIFGAETNLNDPDPDKWDCSELVEWALSRVGIRFVDGSGNQIARCQIIPVEQGIRTRGALLWKPGHIAVSLGDGRTIEAMGARYGVLVANARGRFSKAGLVPNLRY